ncbi:MAG: ABC transporter [Flavobacteriaceae bacterium]|nr:ABC transporter [Flavobacteriaceae bacterium]|tara:strand:- start:1347 stop:3110 length:1764 start_codon:yes stop_codon:yes gene_type:complete
MQELKYLNKYLFKYKWKLLLGIIITIISRIFSLFTPKLVGNSMTLIENSILNIEQTDDDLEILLARNILIILSASLISGFFTFLMRQTIINVSRYIEFDLKNEVYNHYQSLCSLFYKTNRTGDLMSRITEDVSKVRMYVGPAIMYSINTITLFIIVIIFMFSISPSLTIYSLLPLPILSFTIYTLSKKIHLKSTLVQEKLAKLSTFSQEVFSGIKIIKSFNMQEIVTENFDNFSKSSKRSSISLSKVQALFFPLMILLIGISNIIVIYVGGNQYINGKIEIGVIAEFIIYITMLTWPVAVVGWVTSIIQQAEASQKRINGFLKTKPSIKNYGKLLNSESSKITFKNVSFKYPETNLYALEGINFTIDSGKTLGIIGKTGSGKSSILELITRSYDVTSGEIYLGNMSLSLYNLKSLSSFISYVPQNSFLFSDTIQENIKFGNIKANKVEVIEVAENSSIHSDISRFKDKYETLLGERGVNLSGGQIQRITIARALLKKSKILLLDDCLSSVDTKTEKNILSEIKKNKIDETVIIVSHKISSVMHADLIIVLDKGVIIEKGTHEKLLSTDGFYKKLAQKQLENINSLKI